MMTTFHVLIKVNANCNILEIGLTYLLAVIIETILKLTEPNCYLQYSNTSIEEHFLDNVRRLSLFLFSELTPSSFA
jgi:hypothetical protein